MQSSVRPARVARVRARCTPAAAGCIRPAKPGCGGLAGRALARIVGTDPQGLTDRPMVERTFAWLTRGNRRLRYRGVGKNDHWLHHRAAALNLGRLVARPSRQRRELGYRLTTPTAQLESTTDDCNA